MSPHRRLLLKHIETRRPENSDCASIMLGGVSLYGHNEELLENAIDRLERSIEVSLKTHFCLIRQVLQSVVTRQLSEDIPDRVFGAVLGRALRRGRVTSIASLTVNAKVQRAYLLAARYAEFETKLEQTLTLLKSQSAVSVMSVQSTCFPQREWASWYMAQQILGHLALRGFAVFVDKDLFSWPRAIENAIRTNHK